MAEEYSGVKFRTILKDTAPPSDKRLDELRYWCKVFHEKNLTPPYPGGSYGNLSFRIKPGENTFIITGTSIGLKDDLDVSCFVKVTGCNPEKKIIYAEGRCSPSSESMLHYSIYNARPYVQSVFHGHAKEFLSAAINLNFSETATVEPYGSIELVNSVLDILGYQNFFIIKNHGFVSLGNSMKETGERCLMLLNGYYNSI
ncbi:MAG: class II aldolase/adducin family protein [Bacteroidota bacterium]